MLGTIIGSVFQIGVLSFFCFWVFPSVIGTSRGWSFYLTDLWGQDLPGVPGMISSLVHG